MQTQMLVNGDAIDTFAASDPANIALLFDIDGTLIELGPTPFEVDVPKELVAALGRLSEMTGGALALVSWLLAIGGVLVAVVGSVRIEPRP